MITFDNMAKAGLPAPIRSQVRSWVDAHLTQGKDPVALAKLHVNAAGQALRGGGEALLVGGILGAIHAHSKTGLDIKKVPVDGVAGAMLLAAGVFAAQEEVGKDLVNAGQAALAILAFRKTHDVVSEIELKRSGVTSGGGASTGQIKISKAQFAGESSFFSLPSLNKRRGGFHGEDPIVAAARKLV